MNEQAQARILQLKGRLSSISRVSFRSRSGAHSQCHWSGEGRGLVDISAGDNGSLLFTETGRFQLDSPPCASGSGMSGKTAAPRSVPFRNVYRWLPGDRHVALSHERRGPAAAVWLFDLVPADEQDEADFISYEAHLCLNDEYRATLWLRETGFDLEWIITGPKKNEQLYYRYR